MRFFLVTFLFFFSSYAVADNLVIIVNREGPLVEADKRIIKDIYLGEKRFSDSTKLVPVNFTEGPLKDNFMREFIGMSSKEYKLHWIKKVFQEGLIIPQSMGSSVQIISFVKREKGAVAYIPKGVIKDGDNVVIITP